MKTLHLNLIRQWFNMTYLGTKKEEYREVKPHWVKRFIVDLMPSESHLERYCDVCDMLTYNDFVAFVIDCLDRGEMEFKQFKSTTFSNGMTPPVPRFEIEHLGIRIDYGKKEWGAEEGKKYFVISHGYVKKSENIKLASAS